MVWCFVLSLLFAIAMWSKQKTGNAIRALGRLAAVTSSNNVVEDNNSDSKAKQSKLGTRDNGNKKRSNGQAANPNKNTNLKKKSENKSGRNSTLLRDACQIQSKSLQRASDKHVVANNTSLEHDLNLKDTRSEQSKKTLSNEHVGASSSCTVGKNVHRPTQDSVRSRIKRLENSMSTDTRKNHHHSRSEHRRHARRWYKFLL